MDLLTILQASLDMLLTWKCMLSIFAGLVWGVIMGAIPGLGIVLAIVAFFAIRYRGKILSILRGNKQ